MIVQSDHPAADTKIREIYEGVIDIMDKTESKHSGVGIVRVLDETGVTLREGTVRYTEMRCIVNGVESYKITFDEPIVFKPGEITVIEKMHPSETSWRDRPSLL